MNHFFSQVLLFECIKMKGASHLQILDLLLFWLFCIPGGIVTESCEHGTEEDMNYTCRI